MRRDLTYFKYLNSTQLRDINPQINVPIIRSIGYSWIEMIKKQGHPHAKTDNIIETEN
jgi:hypothetical protein